jgi:hypothetical protein
VNHFPNFRHLLQRDVGKKTHSSVQRILLLLLALIRHTLFRLGPFPHVPAQNSNQLSRSCGTNPLSASLLIGLDPGLNPGSGCLDDEQPLLFLLDGVLALIRSVLLEDLLLHLDDIFFKLVDLASVVGSNPLELQDSPVVSLVLGSETIEKRVEFFFVLFTVDDLVEAVAVRVDKSVTIDEFDGAHESLTRTASPG